MIIDMGTHFDGKCCVCREWINPGHPTWNKATPAEGIKHTVAHARCAKEALPDLAQHMVAEAEAGKLTIHRARALLGLGLLPITGHA